MIPTIHELHVAPKGPCPTDLSTANTAVSNTGSGLRAHLLPPGAAFGRICRYALATSSKFDHRKVALVNGRTALDFQKVIGRMKTSPSRSCSQIAANVTILVFGYANGNGVDLRFDETGDCESLTNGHLSAFLTDNEQWFSDLTDLVNLLTLKVEAWNFIR
jgi:hypothetical protein